MNFIYYTIEYTVHVGVIFLASIKAVAQLSGFSVSAVSKYLKNPDSVRKITRARIENAIRELDYTPSTQARALRSGKTGMISIISPNITNPFFSEMFSAIQLRAREYGYTALLQTISSVQEAEESIVSHAFAVSSTNRVDGMIVCFPDEDEIMQMLRNQRKKLPIVLLSWNPQKEADVTVVVDVEKSIFEITNYLIAQGHQKIAYVGAPKSSTTSQAKEKGFFRAMKAAGLNVDDSLIYHGPYCTETGYLATKNFWKQQFNPTAIITEADIFAVGCIKYCHTMGISIPEQLAITGFDDIPIAELYNPSITTVRIPIHEISTKAMDSLYQILHDPMSIIQRIRPYNTQLVIRRSTNASYIEDILD